MTDKPSYLETEAQAHRFRSGMKEAAALETYDKNDQLIKKARQRREAGLPPVDPAQVGQMINAVKKK